MRHLIIASFLVACAGGEEEPIEGAGYDLFVPLGPVDLLDPMGTDDSGGAVDPFDLCAPPAFFEARSDKALPDDDRFEGHDLNTCHDLEDLGGLPVEHAFLIPTLERACGVSDLEQARHCGAVIATFIDMATGASLVALDPGHEPPPMAWIDGEGFVSYPSSSHPGVWFYRLDEGANHPLVAVQTPLDAWSTCGGHRTHPACAPDQERAFYHLWRGVDPASWALQELRNPRRHHVDTGVSWGVLPSP